MCHESYFSYECYQSVAVVLDAVCVATNPHSNPWAPVSRLREEMRTQPQGEDSEAGDAGLRARGENVT